jgi:hypothetical protein
VLPEAVGRASSCTHCLFSTIVAGEIKISGVIKKIEKIEKREG